MDRKWTITSVANEFHHRFVASRDYDVIGAATCAELTLRFDATSAYRYGLDRSRDLNARMTVLVRT